MDLIKSIRGTLGRLFTPIMASAGNGWQYLVDAGARGRSGVSVNGKTALTYSTVWQATNVIAGDVATLPLVLYARTDDSNKTRAKDHPAYRLLRKKPNPYMTASIFRRTMQQHALLWGNGYAEIQRDNRARPLALNVLLPDRTSPIVAQGQLWYVTRVNGIDRKLRPENVLHIRGLGFDGLQGYSVIEKARDSWGLGLAQERYSSTYFRNNAQPTGVLTHPQTLKEETERRILRDWANMHEGIDNQFRTALLQEGMKFEKISLSNRDSQWLEGRRFQREEVASWFNLPPHKVNELSKATFSNIEEQERAYLNQSLMNWLVTWQEECDDKLLTEEEKEADSHAFEFLTAALLRATTKARFETYQVAIQARILNPNECRAMENLNAYEGGDDYINPLITQPGAKAADAQSLLKARLQELVAVECKRVQDAAATSKNFTNWVDGFYDRWEKTVARTLDQVGGAPLHAALHCADSRMAILAQLDHSTAATLTADIAALVATWPNRVDQLAARILANRPAPVAA